MDAVTELLKMPWRVRVLAQNGDKMDYMFRVKIDLDGYLEVGYWRVDDKGEIGFCLTSEGHIWDQWQLHNACARIRADLKKKETLNYFNNDSR